MMKIPDEFMAPDDHGGGGYHGDYQHPQTVQQNHFRRGSLDSPKPVFKVWHVLHFIINSHHLTISWLLPTR